MRPSFTHAIPPLQSMLMAQFMPMVSSAALLASITIDAAETMEGSTRREMTDDSSVV
jgi:hypothetical protein